MAEQPVVLSLEQALSMSYATLRMVHMGWRVIRVEATPVPGRRSKGDPNRYIGRPIAGEDRHSYYVAPNVGKEAIALNLKSPEGQATLHRLVRELKVDVFCTNTLPKRHAELGIDYETMKACKPDLVWCCISAQGMRHPDVPGYDPVMQAMMGFMDLTGDADGPPMQGGLPMTDLKAGDEAFLQVCLALWKRAQTGTGSAIDVSMARCAASWLHTFVPMLDMDSPPSELHRSGNEHRQFIPVNAYPTADGYIYVAIGSDAQWARFASQDIFGELAQERYATNESRRDNKRDLFAEIGACTRRHSTDHLCSVLARAGIPHSPITPITQVAELPFVAPDLLRTTAPDGRVVRLPPAAVDVPGLPRELPFAPRYGEHTDAVLAEAGLSPAEVERLKEQGAVA